MLIQKITDDELREALRIGMTNVQIAKTYKLNIRTVEKRKARLAKKGFSPEHDMRKEVPEGFLVKGVSSYYNKDGDLSGQWVKSQIDYEEQFKLIQENLQTITSEFIPFPNIEYDNIV